MSPVVRRFTPNVRERRADEREATAHRPRWRRWPVLASGAALLAGAAWLAFGFFGVHTLFIDDVVSEDLPEFDSGAPAAPTTEPTAGGSPGSGPETGDAVGSGADEPVVAVVASGEFAGVGRYSGTGTATVLSDGSEQRFIRFEEDFATDNGPDLFVYLGTGSDAYGDPAQYVELGTLRGNIGSQNYEIPAVHPDTGEAIDLDEFDHVAVWCKRFDATFAVATLG